MPDPPAPEGVVLRGPHHERIPCLVIYKGTEPDPRGGQPVAIFEVMPEVAPVGFGTEPGWTVNVRVLPPMTGIRLCMPGEDVWGFVPPSFIEGDD